MTKKVDLQVLQAQYREQGFIMLGEYTKKDEGILCQITQGRYKGYLAEVTPVYIQQRVRKGAQGDIKLTALTLNERKRFMDTETQKRGYTILEYPDQFSPTKPIKIQTPEGKVINSPKWNGFLVNLERGFDKATKRRTDTAEEKYLKRYAIWEHKYSTQIISGYTSTHEKATFMFTSGEFAGLFGTMENAGIREMREPNLRSLTEKSVIQYYTALCADRGLKFKEVCGKGNYRSRAELLCSCEQGRYKGYYCVVSVDVLRKTAGNLELEPSLRQLIPRERIRLIKAIVADRQMKLVSVPEQPQAHNSVTLQCSKGHEYSAKWYQIFQGGGWCPKCKATSGEQRVANILDQLEVTFTREFRIHTTSKNPQFLDFYLPDYTIALEYNGIQHYEAVTHFGGTETLEYLQKLDQAKRDYCKTNGITLLELPYTMSDGELKEKLKKALTKN